MDDFEAAKALFLDGLNHIRNRRYENAERSLRASLRLVPDRISTLTNLSTVLIELGKHDEAQRLVEKVLSLDETSAEAWLNRGLIEMLDKRHPAKAVQHLDRALALRADYAEAHLNRGTALADLGRRDAAIASFDTALALKPDLLAGYLNRGHALRDAGLHEEAIASYARAFQLDPDYDYLEGSLLHARMQVCDWREFEALHAHLLERIARGERAASPFQMLALSGSSPLLRKTAETWVSSNCPEKSGLGPIAKRIRRDRIRIGYFSADYRRHAIAYLVTELFERHRRDQFELIGFSLGPDTDDPVRRRIAASFDRFIDVRGTSDEEVARLSREMEIDIAVDLNGFTDHNRMGIFSHRAAPMQVNYLGYAGTLAAPYFDYLIADRTLIPQDDRRHYAEKIVTLPHSYHPNDANRAVADTAFSRQELGLPRGAFVFCCFNNTYKILPATFEVWMRILKRVNGSVLWLIEDNPAAANNLRREAERGSVSPDRLVFAQRMPQPEHLARHRAADLFLDTLPYNAHKTASDALWVGLPVITQLGTAFPGRVAASLLKAIGLPELIAATSDEFESLAVELAHDSDKLEQIKLKLANNRLTTPLFDIARFTGNIEAAYRSIYERYQAGLAPDHIDVEDAT